MKITGQTEVERFDTFFSNNLDTLRNEARTIFKDRDDSEDILIDLYIKIRKKIATGYTLTIRGRYETTYRGYICRALFNTYKDSLRSGLTKNPKFVDIDNEIVSIRAEARMLDDSHNSQSYYDTLEFLTRNLFQFVEVRYGEKQAFLFKNYYLKPECSTYELLHKMTGYSKSYIEVSLRTMKKDVKSNFIPYMNRKYGKNLD